MKHQAPSTKHQTISKYQAPNRARFGYLTLDIVWNLVLGAWNFSIRSITRRIVLGVVTAILLAAPFFPSAAFAAANPQADPSCWTAKNCTGNNAAGATAKGEYKFNDNVGGTIDTHWEKDAACGSDWGRCYPGEKIPLKVHIPTRGGALTEASNIGQYIGAFYTWGIRIAAILAVIMIMVGGVLWMTSGAADTLQKAKDFIRNAVIGLLLALGSYLMLQTINPDLVKLTPPRLYMIRPSALGVNFCADLPAETTIYEQGTANAKSDRSTLVCGAKFDATASDGTLSLCLGRRCESGKICVPKDVSVFECKPGVFGGIVRASKKPGILLTEICAERVGPARTAGSTAFRFFPLSDIPVIEDIEGGSGYRFMFTTPPTVSSCDGGDVNRIGFVLSVDGNNLGSDVCGNSNPTQITESNVRDRAASLFQASHFAGGGTESCEIFMPE